MADEDDGTPSSKPIMLPKPSSMNMAWNLEVNWKRWKIRFQDGIMMSGNTDDAGIQMAMLRSCLDDDCLNMIDTFELTADDAKNYKKVLEKFDAKFLAAKNITVAMHKFNTRNQTQKEPVSAFIIDLQKLAINCDFGDQQKIIVAHRIIAGVSDYTLKNKLLNEDNPTLGSVIKICKANEETQASMKEMNMEVDKTTEVHAIKMYKKGSDSRTQRRAHEAKAAKSGRSENEKWTA